MSVVGQLYRLQLTDSEWHEKSGRLEEVQASLGETDDVIRSREAVAEAEEGLKRLRSKLRALELDVATVEAKLKQNQDRLYGGRVRNPKELSNLQEEASALGRRQSELEDDQLELMITVEEDEAELVERQARQRQIEANWREDQAALRAEREMLEMRLVELEEDREELRMRVGPADLANYDELKEQLGGTAVVMLKRGVCQGCGVDVPTGVVRVVERGEGPHYCTVCNRILFAG